MLGSRRSPLLWMPLGDSADVRDAVSNAVDAGPGPGKRDRRGKVAPGGSGREGQRGVASQGTGWTAPASGTGVPTTPEQQQRLPQRDAHVAGDDDVGNGRRSPGSDRFEVALYVEGERGYRDVQPVPHRHPAAKAAPPGVQVSAVSALRPIMVARVAATWANGPRGVLTGPRRSGA